MAESLRVLLYGVPIGILSRLPGDKNLFTFDDAYIEDRNRPILSLSFKDIYGEFDSDVRMTRTRLPPFFSNLLPEGVLREYLARHGKINPEHEFFLLGLLGRDLPGAITLEGGSGMAGPLLSGGRVEEEKGGALRFSLAGIQLKFSVVEKLDHALLLPVNGVGGDWILKLPHSTYRDVPENEYVMMELARRVGIDVPEVRLCAVSELEGLPKDVRVLGDYAYAIKRFDRTADGLKVHIEDFAQVFGVYPEKKYKDASYRNIAEVISREIGDVGIVEFIRRFVFNALIGNGDMHLKNWSLIYPGKNRVALAPAYDFVSTIVYLPQDSLALSFAGSKDFSSLTLEPFSRFAVKAKLSEALVLETVRQTVQAFREAWADVGDLPLRGDVRNAISLHLQGLALWRI